MKILFDQGTPVPLRRYLHPHTVDTSAERDWSTLQNGDLLNQAESDNFDALITTDCNLKYQQNLGGRKIRILALTRTSHKIPVASVDSAAQLHVRRDDNRLDKSITMVIP